MGSAQSKMLRSAFLPRSEGQVGHAPNSHTGLHRRDDIVLVPWVEALDGLPLRHYAFGEVEPLGKVLDLACVLGILLRLPIPLIGKPLAGGEWASRQLDRVDRGLCSTRHHDVEQPVCYGEACG